MKNPLLAEIHLSVLLSFALLSGAAFGQRVEDFQVAPQGTMEFVAFGFSSAIDGEWAVVGDTGWRSPILVSTGACVIYRRTEQGWVCWQILTSPLSQFLEQFGASVALHGDELIIGSRAGGHNREGRVYSYRLISDQWVEVQTLRAFDGGSLYEYGFSVAFDAQTLVVGSKSFPNVGRHGACYVYERAPEGWVLLEKLAFPDHTQTPHAYWTSFGWSCSVEGDVMVVGAPTNGGQGMAFVYRRSPSGWQREGDLYLPQISATVAMSLGSSVGVSGGTIAIGAPVPIGGFNPGLSSVWIFEYDPNLQLWQLVQGMRASDTNLAQGNDSFGTRLALRGDRLIVGAQRGGVNGPGQGTAYIFERSNGVWSEVERLVPSDPNGGINGSSFGSSVALDAESNRVLVGATDARAETHPGLPGKAYFYDLNQGSVVCNGSPNLTNAPTRLTVTGSRSVGDANLSLSAYDAPPGLVGIFLVGPGGPQVSIGVGSLCVGQPFARMTGIRTIGPEGSAMLQVDFSSPPASNLVLPGATLTFQFIHRDQIGGIGYPTLNASDAVEVLFE